MCTGFEVSRRELYTVYIQLNVTAKRRRRNAADQPCRRRALSECGVGVCRRSFYGGGDLATAEAN